MYVSEENKLSDKWEHDVYVVISRAGELPVYKVKPENRDGPVRTLHRDLLLPCGFLPASEDSETSCEKVHVIRPGTRRHNPDPDNSTDYPASDEEFEAVILLNRNLPAVTFAVEKDCPVPVVSPASGVNGISPLTQPSVSHVASEVDAEEESGVEEDPAVEESNENLPANLPKELPTVVPLDEEPPEELIQPVEIDIADYDFTLKRSTRRRIPTDRLQYTDLGKPFVSVVQTLLHSLSDILGVSTSSDSVMPSIQVV